MPTDPSVQVIASARFQREIRWLAKRYRRIQQDVQPVIDQLQSGATPGEQVPGSGFDIFKVRIKNRDVQKGKSGGYRLIYYVKTPHQVVLITLYSKSDQGDIAATEIREIIAEFEQSREP